MTPTGSSSSNSSSSDSRVPPAVACKLLACLPEEVGLVDLTGRGKIALEDEMNQCVPFVLNSVLFNLAAYMPSFLFQQLQQAVKENGSMVSITLQMLGNWVERFHVTLWQLQSTTDNQCSLKGAHM